MGNFGGTFIFPSQYTLPFDVPAFSNRKQKDLQQNQLEREKTLHWLQTGIADPMSGTLTNWNE